MALIIGNNMIFRIVFIISVTFFVSSNVNAQGWEPTPHDNSELPDKPFPKIPKVVTKTAVKEIVKKAAPAFFPHVRAVLEVVIPHSIACDEGEVSEYCN